MKKVIRLNENDIEKLVKKIIEEDDRPRGAMLYGGKSEIVDEVVNRINEYGNEYVDELKRLNAEFPVKKYKKIEPPSREEFQIPPGVKVRSTVFPK